MIRKGRNASRNGSRCNPKQGYFSLKPGASLSPQLRQHVGGGKSVSGSADRGLEAAQGLPRQSAELTVGNAAIEAALRQKLLQFQPLGPGQFPFLPRPGLHERAAAAQ